MSNQIVSANGITGQDLKLDEEGKIPLFFDRRLVVTSTEEKDKVFPLFFKVFSSPPPPPPPK